MLDWQLLIIVIRGIIKKRRKKNWWKLDLVQKVEKKQRFIHWITCSWIKIPQFGSQIVTTRSFPLAKNTVCRERKWPSCYDWAVTGKYERSLWICLRPRSRIISIHFMESKGRLTALSVVLDVKDLEPSSFETKFYNIR